MGEKFSRARRQFLHRRDDVTVMLIYASHTASAHVQIKRLAVGLADTGGSTVMGRQNPVRVIGWRTQLVPPTSRSRQQMIRRSGSSIGA